MISSSNLWRYSSKSSGLQSTFTRFTKDFWMFQVALDKKPSGKNAHLRWCVHVWHQHRGWRPWSRRLTVWPLVDETVKWVKWVKSSSRSLRSQKELPWVALSCTLPWTWLQTWYWLPCFEITEIDMIARCFRMFGVYHPESICFFQLAQIVTSILPFLVGNICHVGKHLSILVSLISSSRLSRKHHHICHSGSFQLQSSPFLKWPCYPKFHGGVFARINHVPPYAGWPYRPFTTPLWQSSAGSSWLLGVLVCWMAAERSRLRGCSFVHSKFRDWFNKLVAAGSGSDRLKWCSCLAQSSQVSTSSGMCVCVCVLNFWVGRIDILQFAMNCD